MMPLLFAIDAGATLADGLCAALSLERGEMERRRFPYGESYVRFVTAVEDRDVVLLCSLDDPDAKTITLLFAADAARKQGARSVGLVAPYLAYMRQDMSFQPGEAVTSMTYAALLSNAFDWLVTLDPHLHRYANLEAIYSIPTSVATAAKPIADWLCCNIDRPVIIGPDEESRQWVERIALLAKARSMVLRKARSGDYSVSIDGSALGGLEGHTLVIVDDIASSARTLIEAVHLVGAAGHKEPACVVVHPIFSGDAWHQLHEAGASQIVSTNAIVHETNQIDISAPLSEAISKVAAFKGNNLGTAPRPKRGARRSLPTATI